MRGSSLDRDALAGGTGSRRATLRAGARLLDELPGGRRSLALLIGLTLGEVLAQVVVALAARNLLQSVTQSEPSFPILPVVVAALAALLTFLLVRARHRHQERLAVGSREQAVSRLAQHLHRADIEELSATPMAGLREVLMTDVDFAYRFMLDSISQVTVLVSWLLAALVLTAWLSPPLLGVLVVLGAIVTWAMIRSTRQHLALTPQRFTRLASVSQRARDVVEVERVVVSRQFGLGDLFVRRFLGAHDEFVAVALQQGRLTASMRAVISSLGGVTFLATVAVGGGLVLRDDLGVGSLVAVLFVLSQLLGAVAALGDFAGRLAETATAGRRLMAFWDDPVPRSDDADTRAVHGPISAVSADDLGFGYSGGPGLLQEIDVRLARGRPAALTAETGAGKSTLALLLTGILRPDRGRVTWETDGAALSPELAEPGRVLYVGSKPVLVPGSIEDNLLLNTDPDVQVEDPEELTRFVSHVTAGALRFPITETVVGPNGTGLSSGQAQLVQLARAVRRNPEVIVFDEASSSLDIDTETAVQNALLPWCRERVTLVVSHRKCPWTEFAVDHLTLVTAPGSEALRLQCRTTEPPPSSGQKGQEAARPDRTDITKEPVE